MSEKARGNTMRNDSVENMQQETDHGRPFSVSLSTIEHGNDQANAKDQRTVEKSEGVKNQPDRKSCINRPSKGKWPSIAGSCLLY